MKTTIIAVVSALSLTACVETTTTTYRQQPATPFYVDYCASIAAVADVSYELRLQGASEAEIIAVVTNWVLTENVPISGSDAGMAVEMGKLGPKHGLSPSQVGQLVAEACLEEGWAYQ